MPTTTAAHGRRRGGDPGSVGCECGLPDRIRVDSGTACASEHLDQWAYSNQVQLAFSRRGKPSDNGLMPEAHSPSGTGSGTSAPPARLWRAVDQLPGKGDGPTASPACAWRTALRALLVDHAVYAAFFTRESQHTTLGHNPSQEDRMHYRA